jgi:hypothetical protein
MKKTMLLKRGCGLGYLGFDVDVELGAHVLACHKQTKCNVNIGEKKLSFSYN